MAAIKNDPSITQALVIQRFDYSPETGEFRYRDNFSAKARKGKIAGNRPGNGPYLYIGIGYKRYAAHRLAWLYMTGAWPVGEIDHINGDTGDNRFANLRDATPSQNQYNQKIPKNNKSGVKGLFWIERLKKWRACVAATTQNGFNGYLGIYSSRDDAIAAIKAGRRLLHGEFSNDG